MTSMRWLALLMNLPTTPTRHRVGVWRKLKRMGAVRVKGSAWILPETPDTTERFQWLIQEIQSFGGEATLLRVDKIEPTSDDEVKALFHKERAADYRAAMQACRDVLGRLDRHALAPRGSLDAIKAKLEGLGRELDRIQGVDHLASPLGPRARALWERTARRLRTLEARPSATGGGRRRTSLPPAGSTWVTRPRPHIDRIASAWLIKRFLDPDARFAFAEEADAPKKGVPFDVLGAEFGHQGEDCTFETLLRRARFTDRRLKVIAEVVHEADLRDGKFSRTEAVGVDLAIRGLVASATDDHEVLERGMTVFDGLYAVLKQKT